jgi:hypothetical protein
MSPTTMPIAVNTPCKNPELADFAVTAKTLTLGKAASKAIAPNSARILLTFKVDSMYLKESTDDSSGSQSN